MDKKIKVIIADDIQKIAEMNKEIAMRNDNIEVIGIAYNGKEELDMILKLNPDLVITDNKMPEMTGLEVIEQIKNSNIENKPDFILVTGDSGLELNKKCMELGVFSIVNKLLGERDLMYSIEEYVTYLENTNMQIKTERENSNLKEDKIKKGILSKIIEKVKKKV